MAAVLITPSNFSDLVHGWMRLPETRDGEAAHGHTQGPEAPPGQLPPPGQGRQASLQKCAYSKRIQSHHECQ